MPKKPSKKPTPETKQAAPAPKMPPAIPGLPPMRFAPPASGSTGRSTGKIELAGPRPGAKVSPKPEKKSTPEVRHDLPKRQVDAIREFALTLADQAIDPDAIMICNPISEPAALPLSELLYDRCRWCNVEIYYDRLMPAPLGLMRVCVKCGIMLLEADKKGGN
jgi:hypothetical protein